MQKLILVTAAVFFVGSPALANGPSIDMSRSQVVAGTLLEKNDKPTCDTVSPSKPCTKGNNGFGNGGTDGSPNGFPDGSR